MCAMRTKSTPPGHRSSAQTLGLMASRSVSRSEVATALGISEAALGRRLRGQVPFNADEIDALAQLFSVPAGRFFEEVS